MFFFAISLFLANAIYLIIVKMASNPKIIYCKYANLIKSNGIPKAKLNRLKKPYKGVPILHTIKA